VSYLPRGVVIYPEPGVFDLSSQVYGSRKDIRIAAFSLLCVLLIAFTGFVQAVHVHPADSGVPSHECSLCSVAHAGVVGSPVYRPVPVFTRTTLAVPPEVTSISSIVVFSLRIRPPPEA
jgi:hypothetical protein